MKRKILILVFTLSFMQIQSYSQPFKIERIEPHPRIFLKAGEEERIKQKISENDYLKQVHNAIIAKCDELLTVPTVSRILTGRRTNSGSVLDRIFCLSYACRMTGNDSYKNRAIQEMLAHAAFSDWNPSHFLDVAMATASLSIGYDWLYPVMNEQQKSIIRKAIVEKGIRDSDKYFGFHKSSNNWGQVCNGGMVLGALAVYEDEKELAEKIIRRGVETIRLPLKAYEPDGAYPEGGGYWGYGTGYNVMMNAALESALGSDFGLPDSPGFKESARFVQYSTGTSGKLFNFYDNGEGVHSDIPILYWFAKKYNDPGLLYLAQSSVKLQGRFNSDPLTLIYGSQVDFSQITPPTEKMWVGYGETPVILIRTSWKDRDGLYVGVKGGTPSTSHGHMDMGTFVFDALGERWAMDLGAQNYHTMESAGVDLWSMGQNSQRWDVFRYSNKEHSTLTINNKRQSVKGKAPITEVFKSNKRMGGRIDLSSLYPEDVSQVTRDVELLNEQYLQVTDNITASDNAARITWTLVTPAAVQKTGENEILLTQNGKTVVLSVKSPEKFDLSFVPAAPESGQYGEPNPGVTFIRLSCQVNAKSRTRIQVLLKPVF
ncbi:MAG: heparinase II/III family protein [Tannerella sp.]|jgi:hypothetical protein|nr:heparinase II/III family protein [Tannerella sp.]